MYQLFNKLNEINNHNTGDFIFVAIQLPHHEEEEEHQGGIIVNVQTGVGEWSMINRNEFENTYGANKVHNVQLETVTPFSSYSHEDYYLITDHYIEQLQSHGAKKIHIPGNMIDHLLISCSYQHLQIFGGPFDNRFQGGGIFRDSSSSNIITVSQAIDYSHKTNYPLSVFAFVEAYQNEIQLFLSNCEKTKLTIIDCLSTDVQQQAHFNRSLLHYNGDLKWLDLNNYFYTELDLLEEMRLILNRHLKLGSNPRQRDIPGFEQEMIFTPN